MKLYHALLGHQLNTYMPILGYVCSFLELFLTTSISFQEKQFCNPTQMPTSSKIRKSIEKPIFANELSANF